MYTISALFVLYDLKTGSGNSRTTDRKLYIRCIIKSNIIIEGKIGMKFPK